MFEFNVRDACKAELYHDLHAAMDALTSLVNDKFGEGE